MKMLIACAVVSALTTVIVLQAVARPGAAGPQLAHMVFFQLKDPTPANRERLVAACHTLSVIDGVTYFSVGTRAEDVEEKGVSVKDFDVALHSVFESKAAKEAYLIDPVHKAFVDNNKDLWSGVRVFDSYVTNPPGH